MRYRRSINLGGGVRLNFGKRGVGVSVGTRHVRYGVNTSGRRTSSVSLPGTGIAWRASSGAGHRTRPRQPVPAAARPARPGLFAPKAEKQLYRLMGLASAHTATEQWAGQLLALQEDRALGTAARVLAGVLLLELSPDDALRSLTAVLQSGADPAADRFLARYCPGLTMTVSLDGVDLQFPIDRDLVAALAIELHEQHGDLGAAATVADLLPDSEAGCVIKADLALASGRPEAVLPLTENLTNTGDLATLALAVRGGALRELGHHTAALEVLREALRYPSRAAGPRHRAWFERARVYRDLGQRAKARSDLERILAEDSAFPHVADELAELARPQPAHPGAHGQSGAPPDLPPESGTSATAAPQGP